MASFMRKAYIRRFPPCQAARDRRATSQGRQNQEKVAKNANDHEQQARVHPAQRCYCVVVQAPELGGSINGALKTDMGTTNRFRKVQLGTSLMTGPLGAA